MTCLRSASVAMLAVAVVSATLATGCSKTEQKTKSASNQDTKKDSKRIPPETPLPAFVPPTGVELQDTTPEQLQAFVAGHKGKAILIDYWATWCGPCKKAFPHTVALSKKYAGEGLVVVSVCVDKHEQRGVAIEFLKNKDARIINFYPSDKLDPDTLDQVFKASSFPLYRIYGADGKLIKAVTTGGKTREQARQEIDEAVLTALGYK